MRCARYFFDKDAAESTHLASKATRPAFAFLRIESYAACRTSFRVYFALRGCRDPRVDGGAMCAKKTGRSCDLPVYFNNLANQKNGG